MNPIFCNTEKMTECGQDLIELSSEYLELIELMTNRLIKIPTETGEWTGESAMNFMTDIKNIDVVKFNNFGNEIKTFGETLIADATTLEEAINQCKIK